MARLDGKVAVVTGGASGIGEGTVRLFAAEGAKVVIADVQESRGEKLAEELGTNTTFVRTDVSQESDVAAAVDLAVRKFGRLDCMYNNAGFGGVSGPIEDLDMAEYDRTMAVLLRGVFCGVKHAVRVMKPQGSGSIVSTASVAGVGAIFGPVVYSAAKAAVIHMSKALAVELAPFGIRVNAICPGGIATPIFGKGMGLTPEQADGTIEFMKTALAQSQPIKRSGMPSDIAEAALWLASDASSFVTGHALVVDGGITLAPGGLFSGDRMQMTPEQRRERFAAMVQGQG
ncbi:MAG TPA: glucose 1-dehydrogenase [Tepidiformaceae bacterium]|nr:glucose 1-dehydrogenase [Tepidiformaceae bacterium]